MLSLRNVIQGEGIPSPFAPSLLVAFYDTHHHHHHHHHYIIIIITTATACYYYHHPQRDYHNSTTANTTNNPLTLSQPPEMSLTALIWRTECRFQALRTPYRRRRWRPSPPWDSPKWPQSSPSPSHPSWRARICAAPPKLAQARPWLSSYPLLSACGGLISLVPMVSWWCLLLERRIMSGKASSRFFDVRLAWKLSLT